MTDESLELPPPSLRFRRGMRIRESLRDLWRVREVIGALVERELRSRYAQAVLGFAWVLIGPFVLMVVFSVFFNRVAKIDTHGIPYALFSYVGLLPWTFFSGAVSSGGMALVSNVALLNKVYAPREVFVLSSVATKIVDTTLAALALVFLFLVKETAPKGTSVWVPLLLLILLVFTTAVTLLAAALTVYLRDLRHALPLILQLGMFATPVLYGSGAIPHKWRLIYAGMNPVAATIDGLRQAVLYGHAPRADTTLVAAAVSVVWLLVGYAVFKQLEAGFADVA